MPHTSLVRLAIGALAVVPAVALPGTALAAGAPTPPSTTSTQTAADPTTAPPPGSADANALLIDPLLAIGHSSATAGQSGGSATGNAVEVGGKPLVDGATGGTQQGTGSKHGSLLDTGVTPLGQLQVTPWSASVTSTADGTSSDGDAALLRLFLVDPKVLRAAVLQSHSHAQSSSSGSSSSASSDGATVNAGDGALDVTLLHAESSSSSGGSSYLVGINGNTIGSSKDANGSCALDVPGVVSLSCLTATGGTSGTTKQAASAVGSATLGSGQGHGTLVGTKATGQSATLGSGTPHTSPASSSSSASASNASSSNRSGLPFTGTDLPPVLAVGALLVAAGAWAQQAARRLRRGGLAVS